MSEAKKAMYRKRQGGRTMYQNKLNPRQKNQVKRIVNQNVDKKYNEDSITDAYPMTTTPVTFQLSIIPQGQTEHRRIGDALHLTSVNIRFGMLIGDSTNNCRIIFYQWKPVSFPSPSNILSPGIDGTNIDVYSMYNPEYESEYKILYDKQVLLQGFGTAASPFGPGSEKIFKKTIAKKLLKKLSYVNGSSTVGSNQFYYLVVSDSLAAANPTLSMKVRFNYTDA